MSLSVIAGSSGRAQVTLMPLRGESGPAARTRATTSLPRTSSTDSRGTPSPITISERSVTSPAKPSKSTSTRFAARRMVPAEHDGLVQSQAAWLDLRAQPQLGALEVEQQADRPPRPLGGRADVGRAPAQVVVRAVGAVEPGAVEPGRDHRVEHPLGVGGGPESGDDLGVPAVHGRSLAARVCSPR